MTTTYLGLVDGFWIVANNFDPLLTQSNISRKSMKGEIRLRQAVAEWNTTLHWHIGYGLSVACGWPLFTTIIQLLPLEFFVVSLVVIGNYKIKSLRRSGRIGCVFDGQRPSKRI